MKNKCLFFQVKMSVEIEVFIECEDDDFPGLYAISDKGNVINLKTGNIPKTFTNDEGYLKVHFCGHNKHTSRFVHRLLAKAWIPNPENKPVVDHVDRNNQNNTLSNLRWASLQENSLNRGVVEFSQKYSITHCRTLLSPSKWLCQWRQNDILKKRYFLNEEEARKFAIENLEGKPFLQPLNKPKV